jgi:hypothetical protein
MLQLILNISPYIRCIHVNHTSKTLLHTAWSGELGAGRSHDIQYIYPPRHPSLLAQGCHSAPHPWDFIDLGEPERKLHQQSPTCAALGIQGRIIETWIIRERAGMARKGKAITLWFWCRISGTMRFRDSQNLSSAKQLQVPSLLPFTINK